MNTAEQFPDSMPYCMWIHRKSFISYKIYVRIICEKITAPVERDEVWVSVHKSDVEMKIKIVNFDLAHPGFTKAIKIQPSLFIGLV